MRLLKGNQETFKQDISKRAEALLSIIVFNTWELYVIRDKAYFCEVLDSKYIFTDKQLEILLDDLIADEV